MRHRGDAADEGATEFIPNELLLAWSEKRIEREKSPPADRFFSLFRSEQTDPEGLGHLLSIHPSLEERIERIKERASKHSSSLDAHRHRFGRGSN